MTVAEFKLLLESYEDSDELYIELDNAYFPLDDSGLYTDYELMSRYDISSRAGLKAFILGTQENRDSYF